MTAAIDFTAISATRATRQVITLMDEAGLNPHYGPEGAEAFDGTVRVFFGDDGCDGVFGAVLIGADSGQIVRGEIWYGSRADRQPIAGCADIRRHVLSLIAVRRVVA
jgi:hypothetical protein